MENKRKDGKVPCMRCTEEQYKRDLRKPLLDMGFREMDMQCSSEYTNLVANWMNAFGYIGIAHYNCINTYNRFLIKPYNPELFLSEVRKCVYGEEENLDEKYPYWYISKRSDGIVKRHARLITDDVKGRNNLLFERLNLSMDDSNIIKVDSSLKVNDNVYFVLKSEYVEDLPINTPVMVELSSSDYALRYYAGNNRCYLYGEKSHIAKDTVPLDIIIPFDKFDPNNIKESLKYNIVKK